MRVLLAPALLASLLWCGAIFGFFYAWVCSTMWGLDQLDPRVAIEAMNAMNISVRNGVFLTGFFGTPVVLGVTSAIAVMAGEKRVAGLVLGAALLYLVGAFIPTRLVNVEMNWALEAIGVPKSIEAASAIWQDYSPKWQLYNQGRTVISGLCLALVGWACLNQTRAAPCAKP